MNGNDITTALGGQIIPAVNGQSHRLSQIIAYLNGWLDNEFLLRTVKQLHHIITYCNTRNNLMGIHEWTPVD